MGTFTSLGDLVQKREERENRLNGDKPEWFSSILKERKGKPVKIRFMQELSDQAKLYNEERGTFFGADEHEAPGPLGYQARAVDTTETEGRDWAQEQDELCWGLGWQVKTNLYINVAVEHIDPSTGKKEVRPAILSRPIGSKFVKDLIKRYNESDGVGITDKTFWLTREGQGAQTTWELEVVKDADDQINFDHLECWDLAKKAVTHKTYDEQKAFYLAKADLPYARRELAERRAKKNKTSIQEELGKMTLPDYELERSEPQEERNTYRGDEGEPGPETAGAGAASGGGKKKYGW